MPAADTTALAALLARAEQDIAAQRQAYGTELDEETAWRCAWNTWRTLAALVPAVRNLLAENARPATGRPFPRLALVRESEDAA